MSQKYLNKCCEVKWHSLFLIWAQWAYCFLWEEKNKGLEELAFLSLICRYFPSSVRRVLLSPALQCVFYREHGDERSLDKQATCLAFHSKPIAEALSFLPLNSCYMIRKELIMLCLFIWMPQSISFALIKLWKLLPSKGIVRIENKLDTGHLNLFLFFHLVNDGSC